MISGSGVFVRFIQVSLQRAIKPQEFLCMVNLILRKHFFSFLWSAISAIELCLLYKLLHVKCLKVSKASVLIEGHN